MPFKKSFDPPSSKANNVVCDLVVIRLGKKIAKIWKIHRNKKYFSVSRKQLISESWKPSATNWNK